MLFNLKFNKIAYEEFIQAFEWYELKENGLGKRFMNAVEKRINLITTHPERYPIQKLNFRQVKIENFPYVVVYEYLKQKKTIHIAAIYHSKRNPKLRFRKL